MLVPKSAWSYCQQRCSNESTGLKLPLSGQGREEDLRRVARTPKSDCSSFEMRKDTLLFYSNYSQVEVSEGLSECIHAERTKRMLNSYQKDQI